jgi:hypothetical protein
MAPLGKPVSILKDNTNTPTNLNMREYEIDIHYDLSTSMADVCVKALLRNVGNSRRSSTYTPAPMPIRSKSFSIPSTSANV